MRNRYGGNCYRCDVWVAPGEGHFERVPMLGSWRVQHADCAIKYRSDPSAPDPLRERKEAWREAQLKKRALGTGKRAQRARQELKRQEGAA